MTLNRQKTLQTYIPIIIPLSVILLFTVLSFSSVYQNLVYTTTDWKWQNWHHSELADTNVVMVAIDNASLAFVEENLQMSWPWPRQFYALILDYFNDAGAASVTFDILFDTAERGRPEFPGGSSDSDFSEALSRSKSAVLAAMIDDRPLSGSSLSSKDLYTFSGRSEMPGKLFRSAAMPITEFRMQGTLTGIANFHTDSDGVCRRLPLLFNMEEGAMPQLAFAAFLLGTEDELQKYQKKTGDLHTRKNRFSLDENGYYPMYWYGPGDAGGVFRYDSFQAVLLSAVKQMQGQTPDIPLREFQAKHIIICASASGLVDLKSTPFTAVNPYPGGEIHATLMSNLLNGHRMNTFSGWLFKALLLLISAALSLSFLKQRLRVSLLLILAALSSIFLLNGYIFYYRHGDFDLLFASLTLIFSSGSSSLYRMVTESLAKRQLRSMFSRYLSDDVISILLQDPERIDLEGSEITGTVLFTDLQNFTSYSEDKTPRQVITVLNRYFGILTGIVLRHGGLLDKYTGDGIMAIFGAPLPKADHARAACEAILDFRQHNVNELIPTEKGEIATRIGVSSGPMVVGNLGSSQRMDYTAVGDTVNLSARLESVNKTYGTTNIVSEYTWEYVRDEYLFRELDYIRVKGKNRPIRIFTLIDRFELCDDAVHRREKAFSEAYKKYREKQWPEAFEAFTVFSRTYPEDTAARAFIQRITMLIDHPTLVDADGVFTFKSK